MDKISTEAIALLQRFVARGGWAKTQPEAAADRAEVERVIAVVEHDRRMKLLRSLAWRIEQATVSENLLGGKEQQVARIVELLDSAKEVLK
jgi:hypothetical protein